MDYNIEIKKLVEKGTINMQNKIPMFLYNKLIEEYGEELAEEIITGYSKKRLVTLRVNTLKTNTENIMNILNTENIKYNTVEWSKDALIIENANENDIRNLGIYINGEIYLQSLSSMIPPIILEAQKDENILDMTSAPGGKTTQIAALTNNTALITACEKNKIRLDKLKYNIEKQGATKVNVMNVDARKLDDFFAFDKILLDAPCSGSGTIYIEDKNLQNIFTEELLKRSIKTQNELLQKAIKILKPGKELVYSTCSILKEENEENIQKIVKKGNIEIVPLKKENLKGIPMLPVKLDGTICVKPTELYEGFFVAKIKKLK